MPISALHVTAADLDSWSRRRTAQDQLPRLLRDLIFAVDASLRSITMVSGEGVQQPGWDGVVYSNGAGPFVPPGTSGWEISVKADIDRKADEDYQKRVEDPLSLDPLKTTFVFATSRSWPGKRKWVKEKGCEGIWHDVKVVDAHDLESWLERAPAIHLRLSEELGKKPPGVTDLVSAGVELANSTTPPVSNQLIIGGRSKSVERIHEMLADDHSVVSIAADSREEALAFFGAALEQFDDLERGSILARCVVVRDSSAWHTLAARDEGLVLIPTFEDRANTGAASRNGHRVILPLGREEARSSEAAVEIGRPRREALQEALESLGVPTHRAAELAAIGRRSFLSLKRQIARAPDVEQPPWALPEHAPDLLPAMFVGSWVDGNEKDQGALEKLSGRSYAEWSRIARRWANESDPPLRSVGDVWLVASKEDGWRLLRPAIRRHDLDGLREVCLEVFEWIDTRYDLPPDEQWTAGLFKEEPEYSGGLRKGLADTLAMLGARSADFALPLGSGEAWTSWIVREILEGADDDWRRWATLGDVLPLLAEAAPDEFVSALERGARGAHPILARLFFDQSSSLWSHSPHTQLLWALERLAWSPKHLPRAALVLARLARLDPGGTTTNRPFDSLSRIFLVVRPHTAADRRTRRQVLETILQREADIGFRLLVELIPEHRISWMSTDRPERRDWSPEQDVPRTWPEIFSEVDAVVDLALSNAGANGFRWAALIGAIDRLQQETFEKLVTALQELDPGAVDVEGRRAMLDALRDLISRHRTYADADWAVPEELVDQLERIHGHFEFDDPIERYRWLFCKRPALIDLTIRDWEEKRNSLHEKRVEAIKEIYEARGLEGVFNLAVDADAAVDLGSTLGREEIISTAEEYELLGRGLASDDGIGEVARGFSWAAARRRGARWIRETLESAHDAQWTEGQKADFLLATPHRREVWRLVDGLGGNVPHLYWSRVRTEGLAGYSLAEEAAKKLLQYRRPYSAIVTLGLALHAEPDPASWNLIIRALEEASRTDPRADRTVDTLSYHVESLLVRIADSGDVPEDKLAQLEWSWLALLDSTRRSAALLHRELARNPRFFADIVALVYKAEGDEKVEASADVIARARQGNRLLRSWRSLPGIQEDGSLDANELGAWVETALEVTRESGRGEIAEFLIGQVLSRSPRGQDDHWPDEAVREVVERLESEFLERGIENGRYNSRGVVTRGPYEGGTQERELADAYENDARALTARAPRTAAMLRRLAATYGRAAERVDQLAELREDGE